MPASRYTVAAKWVRRFRQWKLTEPQDVLDLPGEVVSGHANRHVIRTAIGSSPRRIDAYLKREHRVRWRDRLKSWWRGFGAVSLSGREAQVLSALRRHRVPTPKVLACGEHEGQAFLLLSAVRGAMDLRLFLHQMGAAVPEHRRSVVARRLGEGIARTHAAGFDMPDLLSKHVLIHPHSLSLTLIDWARTGRYRQIGVRQAARDLGRLQASLVASLATPRDRLRCLHSYWISRGHKRFCRFRQLVTAVQRAARSAERRRSVQELRQLPTEPHRQHLRWVDAERLCVTRPLWRSFRGFVPSWLRSAARSNVQRELVDNVFSQSRRWILHRWPAASWWRRWTRILGRRVETALTRQAGVHFRLKRYGIAAPTVLAFGRRSNGAGFLLTRPLPDTVPLNVWLDQPQPRRCRVLMQTGAVLHQLHAAGLRLGVQCDLLVVLRGMRVGLSGAPRSPMPKPAGRWPFVDLRAVTESLRLSDADSLRLIRGYLGAQATERDGRKLTEVLRGELPSAARADE